MRTTHTVALKLIAAVVVGSSIALQSGCDIASAAIALAGSIVGAVI